MVPSTPNTTVCILHRRPKLHVPTKFYESLNEKSLMCELGMFPKYGRIHCIMEFGNNKEDSAFVPDFSLIHVNACVLTNQSAQSC